ncbi:hypothetical protein MY11210_006152 [Beauveria gryllotalpidicola]
MPTMHTGNVHLGVVQTNSIHSLAAIFRPQKGGHGRWDTGERSFRVAVEVYISRTLAWKLASECVHVHESLLRLSASSEHNTGHYTKVRSRAFQCPQEVSFILWPDGIIRLMLIRHSADDQHMAAFNTDHDRSDYGVAGKPMQPSQVTEASLQP